MRLMILLPLLAAAACTDEPAPAPKAEAAAAAALTPGQWETVLTVGKVESRDDGVPVMKAADSAKASSCVGADEGRKPPPAVLAGYEGCRYDTVYMARGRVTATMSCTRPGLQGRVMVSSEGRYTADSFETDAVIETSLVTDGDVRAAAKIVGRRTGDCAAPGAA